MIVYTKICAICQKKFYATRLNKTYCSKPCANRTRYLPKDLVAQLVSRNSKYMLKANKYAAMVTNEDGIDEVVGATVTPQAVDDLETYARTKARERGIKVPTTVDIIEEENKQKSMESESGFVVKEEQEKNHESNSGTSDKSS